MGPWENILRLWQCLKFDNFNVSPSVCVCNHNMLRNLKVKMNKFRLNNPPVLIIETIHNFFLDKHCKTLSFESIPDIIKDNCFQKRRCRPGPWILALRGHRDHHHERVPQVQICRAGMSRILRLHTPRINKL